MIGSKPPHFLTTERGAALTLLAVLLGAFICWLLWRYLRTQPKEIQDTQRVSFGGRGGDAKVGGSGTALGGPGGAAGLYGVGGIGGSGEVQGDGFAAGGEGGHAGDYGVLTPPARSGYVWAMRQQGRAADPALKHFGRGGVSPEYYEKLKIVLDIQDNILRRKPSEFPPDPEHSEEVLVDEINYNLEDLGLKWRIRLYDGQYEFFTLRR